MSDKINNNKSFEEILQERIDTARKTNQKKHGFLNTIKDEIKKVKDFFSYIKEDFFSKPDELSILYIKSIKFNRGVNIDGVLYKNYGIKKWNRYYRLYDKIRSKIRPIKHYLTHLNDGKRGDKFKRFINKIIFTFKYYRLLIINTGIMFYKRKNINLETKKGIYM